MPEAPVARWTLECLSTAVTAGWHRPAEHTRIRSMHASDPCEAGWDGYLGSTSLSCLHPYPHTHLQKK